MTRKIAFIGAGSLVFTRNLVRDILTFPAFADCELALMDISEVNLGLARRAAEKIVQDGRYPATVTATTDRAKALQGADGVLTTILTGGTAAVYQDIAIPKEYGISYCVGDTRGPSAIFRFLRTLPPLLDVLADVEAYCPQAIWLNYTNPMAMLCRALQGSTSKVTISGLCHSVQGTGEMLARWIGAPISEITYTCAGINHQAHYIKYEWNGQDAYPLIYKAITENPAIYNEEQVRNEMFLKLGYYVTESSGHNSEYNAWFRKRPDLLERYCTHGTGWNPGLDWMIRNKDRIVESDEERHVRIFNEWIGNEFSLARGSEYAAYIFNAVFGDHTLFEFNGNVRNFGIIDNLPVGACVEVPVLASQKGLESIHVGALPPQLAVLNALNAACEELAVEGALEGDPRKIYHACLYDPMTSAICSMQEIEDMVKKLFAVQKEWLPQFKHTNW